MLTRREKNVQQNATCAPLKTHAWMPTRRSLFGLALLLFLFSATVMGCGSDATAPADDAGGGGIVGAEDVQAPSAPLNLGAEAVSSSQINLAWDAAADDRAVVGYTIYRNGSALVDLGAATYSDTGLTADTAYTYEVTAYDAAGNESERSDSVTATTSAAQTNGLKAFPGAEGFGAYATGGRGGQVIKVTSLAADGPGSLQQALNVKAPRTIVFAVSGVIEADIVRIPYGDVTIAGQTAPGGGITIKGRLYGAYQYGVDNMIIRHLRIRPAYDGSDGEQFDGIQFSRNRRLIFDHISVAFGVDETIDIYEAQDVTLQWSTIEMSGTTGHPEGLHNYGLISGPSGTRVSVHHNLFAHHRNRCPAIANGPSEVINNVVYNVRHGFVHHNPASGQFNIVGNHYIDGADDTLIPFYFDDEDNGSAPDLSYFLADNFIDDPSSSCDGVVDNPWSECSQNLNLGESYRSNSMFDFSGRSAYYAETTVHPSGEVFGRVMERAGAFPRDTVTRRAIQETTDGTGTWGAYEPGDYMEGLVPAPAPQDSDNDGMADAWELAHGLDPTGADDFNTVMPSGYTAIEVYINELAEDLTNS